MNRIILFLLFLAPCVINAQIGGDLKTDNRGIIDSISFVISSKTTGVLVYNIVVDRTGEVTACDIDKVASSIKSQKSQYEAKNRILTYLKFEASNKFPVFHYGTVTFTVE